MLFNIVNMAFRKERKTMFNKKWEKFANGKTFYMIDRHNFEIRKTKIYGYQYAINFLRLAISSSTLFIEA